MFFAGDDFIIDVVVIGTQQSFVLPVASVLGVGERNNLFSFVEYIFPHIVGDFGVDFRDGIGAFGEFQCTDGETEHISLCAGDFSDGIDIERAEKSHTVKQVDIMLFVACRFGRVCCENDTFFYFMNITVFFIEFKCQRYCVTFIHVVDIDFFSKCFECFDTADTQYDLLCDSGFMISVVESGSDSS